VVEWRREGKGEAVMVIALHFVLWDARGNKQDRKGQERTGRWGRRAEDGNV